MQERLRLDGKPLRPVAHHRLADIPWRGLNGRADLRHDRSIAAAAARASGKRKIFARQGISIWYSLFPIPYFLFAI